MRGVMRASTRRSFVAGPAGRIECAIDSPEAPARGMALIAHPHPLFGGTLDNKVVQTLARAFVELGYEAWRPNFRGVGASEGRYDEGRGELEDLTAVLAFMKTDSLRFLRASRSAPRCRQCSPRGCPPQGGPSAWCWSAWR